MYIMSKTSWWKNSTLERVQYDTNKIAKPAVLHQTRLERKSTIDQNDNKQKRKLVRAGHSLGSSKSFH